VGDAATTARLAGAALQAKAARPGLLAARTVGAGALVVLEAVGIVITLDHFGDLAGWEAGDVAFLIGLGEAGVGFAMFLGDTLEPPAFSLLVREGRLDPLLARPFPVLLSVVTNDVQVREVGRGVVGVGVVAWGAWQAGVGWTPDRLAVTALAVVCCTAIVFAVLLLGAASTLYTVEGSEFVNAFTYGGAALSANPLDVYSSALRFVFVWVVPFGLAVYVPALHVLDRDGAPGVPASLLAITPVATAAFGLAAGLAWRRGLRHYASTGS
jgi:ABC-2 type transport system permease protein